MAWRVAPRKLKFEAWDWMPAGPYVGGGRRVSCGKEKLKYFTHSCSLMPQ
jgi:hypothetical protein